MKTKIVYCLVSDSNDYYYEQLLISLHSLRKHNPRAEVEVVCDSDTYGSFTGNRRGIFNYDIRTNVVETPAEWGKWERSRYIKTNLRRLVKGDYLFVDTDTIVCSNIEFVDDIPHAVAAVKDSHLERPLPRYAQRRHDTEKWIWRNAKKAGVDVAGIYHYNSGVMYVKDTEAAYELYAKWAENYSWLLARGAKVDQLALLLANKSLNNVIEPLDPALNCQVCFKEGRERLAGAHIVHYFPGQGKNILSSPWILDPIKESGRINISIQRIIDDPGSFFAQESMIAWGDEVALIRTPLMGGGQKAFNCFIWLMGKYYHIKRHLRKVVKI